VYRYFEVEGNLKILWNQARLELLQLAVLLFFPSDETVFLGFWRKQE